VNEYISIIYWYLLKDFIKTGRSKAVVRVTLSNQGRNCYQPDVYGDFITIERTINATGSGGYKILNERGKWYLVVSKTMF